eukprot:m.64470 g.64470  ORF g.64470 m.64470 type:complete len:303 (+) comp11652_c0_seq2:147-1055(+)
MRLSIRAPFALRCMNGHGLSWKLFSSHNKNQNDYAPRVVRWINISSWRLAGPQQWLYLIANKRLYMRVPALNQYCTKQISSGLQLNGQFLRGQKYQHRNELYIMRYSSTHSSTPGKSGKQSLESVEAAEAMVHNMDAKSRAYLMAALSYAEVDKVAGFCSVFYLYQLYFQEDVSKTAVEQPTTQQLSRVFTRSMVPMIGFGFVDNFIMLTAGDAIDHTIGAWLQISTLAAAGLGNLVSDVAGLGLSSSIEGMSAKCGLKSPKLTIEQLRLPITRKTMVLASIVGITLGCLLGMFPLHFIPTS